MNNTITNIISSTIKEKGLTEEGLANVLNVEVSTIIAYELGVKYPTIEGLKKMCFELEKTPDELYTGSRKPPLTLKGLTNDQKRVIRELRIIMKSKGVKV